MWTYLYFCVRIYHDKFCKMLHKLTQGIEDILHSPCFPKVITWMTRMSGWNLPSIILVLQVYGICILYSIYVIQDSLKTKWLLFVYDHLIFLSNPFYQSNSLMLRDLILFCPWGEFETEISVFFFLPIFTGKKQLDVMPALWLSWKNSRKELSLRVQ